MFAADRFVANYFNVLISNASQYTSQGDLV